MRVRVVVALVVALAAADGGGQPLHSQSVSAQGVQKPVLMWQNAGCYSSWCETGWYSSPAVADLNGDGHIEVIASAYPTFILDGATGSLIKTIPPSVSGARIWPGVVVADVNADGKPEIVLASGSGYVRVLDHTGAEIWRRQPTTSELRGLSVYDLDGTGHMDIIVTGALGSQTNTWVYDYNGNLRAGWPQLVGASGYAAGVYNANAAVGDLFGDGRGEIVVPSDVHYICAYKRDGTQIGANSMYGSNKKWGSVGIWEDPAIELRGWGKCDGTRSESYRTNFADGPADIADVNHDGIAEVVATGNVYDCHAGYPPSRYDGVYIFNADRSRFTAPGLDWTHPPTDTGAPLSENYSVIESAEPNPVLADIDGDGKLETLFASYDGRLHAFWLDKTEHYSWPYAVYTGTAPLQFASEPVVADLDNDGHAEVIFTSWTQKGSKATGNLYILDYQGKLLWAVPLPNPYGGTDWNGALAAPTLADIDGDGNLEVVVNTANSGVAAYKLPGTSNARILWGTGRNNYQRTGSFLSLRNSTLSMQPISPAAGQPFTYTLTLAGPGPTLYGVHVTDTLPAQSTYLGNVWASAGSAAYTPSPPTVTWTGNVSASVPVTITFGLTLTVSAPTVVTDTAISDDGLGQLWLRSVTAIGNAKTVYLPLCQR
jgi:hypothetical protein